MVFQYWHLAVVAVLGALIIWGFRISRQRTLLGLAASLITISGFLLYTLVLDEPSVERDLNGRLDALALIGIPAVLGLSLGVLAVRRARSRRA